MRFRLLPKNFTENKYRTWILMFGLLVGFTSVGQTVSLSFHEASIETVFSEIKKQTSIGFVCSSEQIKEAKPVSISVRNQPLKDVLDMVFNDQPLTYLLQDNLIIVKDKPKPEKTIYELKGTVTDEKGDGISGASVNIQNGREGTATDDKGTFVLKTEREHPVLVISSVGFLPAEFAVADDRYITVKLSTSVSKLDEQVIIAYGTTTRRLSTGAVSEVRSEDISTQPVSNPLLALNGRVSGLQITQNSGAPGSYVSVLLRGRNSVANGTDPLFIVDGVPFNSTSLTSSYGGGAGIISSPLDNLNPSDIESIDVLKDADATAIYGSRGANGVILITTKKAMGNQGKTEVNFYQGFGTVTRTIQMMNTPQYLQMRREAFLNDGVTPTAANAKDLLVWDTTRYTDWQKVLIGNTASITDLHANVSGGSANTQILVGGGYHKETTVYSSQFGETKFYGDFSLSHTSTNKRFKISLQGHYTYNENLLPQTDLTAFITLPPDAPAIYDSAGNLNWQHSTWQNPISEFQKQYKTTTDNLMTNLLLEWKISRHLAFKTSFGYTHIQMNELITTPLRYYDPALASSATSYAGFGNNAIRTIIIEPQLNYQQAIGKKANVQLLTGATLQQNNQNSLLETGYGFTSDQLIDNIKAASSITIDNTNITKYRYLGLFSRLQLDFDRKYLATFTARRDGSSRFGPANRFSNFGSVGGAWIFSNEDFLLGLRDWLSTGKIRASYGITGNDQIGDYKYLNTYSPYTYVYQNVSPLYPTQLFNPDYNWEKVRKTDIGLDLGLFKDHILFTINYYRDVTSNQLVQSNLPTVTGFSGVLMNIPATILNKGWEFEVSGALVKKKNWEWSASFNLTIPQNKLLSFPGIESSTYASTYVVGQSLFISKRYHLMGVDPTTGIYVFEDYNKDGKITSAADQQSIVFTGQQLYGGLQNNFKYKGWQFSFFFQFIEQKNGSDYLSRFTAKPGSLINQPVVVLSRWQKPGDITTIEKFSNSNALVNTAFSNLRFSDAAFSNASFIRLKNISLSYEFSEKVVKKILLTHIKAFVQGQNLFTLTGYDGLDPETKTVMPPLKILAAGLQVIF